MFMHHKKYLKNALNKIKYSTHFENVFSDLSFQRTKSIYSYSIKLKFKYKIVLKLGTQRIKRKKVHIMGRSDT